jgi:hypothetical protein
MIVVSAAGSDERLNLGTRDACEVVNSIGTDSYGDVCFAMLERALNAEHWALFRFRSGSPLKCVATASKRDKAAAKENCERFVGHCYSVDPSVKVASTRRSAPTLTKMAIDDIEDPQYRHCFELTHVQERVSLFFLGRPRFVPAQHISRAAQGVVFRARDESFRGTRQAAPGDSAKARDADRSANELSAASEYRGHCASS